MLWMFFTRCTRSFRVRWPWPRRKKEKGNNNRGKSIAKPQFEFLGLFWPFGDFSFATGSLDRQSFTLAPGQRNPWSARCFTLHFVLFSLYFCGHWIKLSAINWTGRTVRGVSWFFSPSQCYLWSQQGIWNWKFEEESGNEPSEFIVNSE